MRNILLIIFLAVSCLLSARGDTTYLVTKDKINIREDSTVASTSLGYLSRGDEVEVLLTKFEWYKIRLPEEFSCYVAKEYIESLSQTKGRVRATKLNLRAKPTLEARIIGMVNQGTTLSIRSEIGDWFQVSAYPHASGWIHKKFLAEIKEELDLAQFVETMIPELTKADIAEKQHLHQALIEKGLAIVPILENYLSSADSSTAYSLIAILTQVGKTNPKLAGYFLEKVDPDESWSASIYLDVAQGIIDSGKKKIPYFHLANQKKLSRGDILTAVYRLRENIQ